MRVVPLWQVIGASTVCGVGALWWASETAQWALWWLTLLIAFLGSFLVGAAWSLTTGPSYQPTSRPIKGLQAQELLMNMVRKRKKFEPCQRPIVVSLGVDGAIQELMDLVMRDFVVSWYQHLGNSVDSVQHLIQDDVWETLAALSARLQQVDWVAFLTQEVVTSLTQHFHNISQASNGSGSSFQLHSWLVNKAEETGYLRDVSEVLLMSVLPPRYTGCTGVCHLLREILTSSVLQPSVEMICDPDYINQKLYDWLDYRERLASEHNKSYAYAASYENFVRIIDDCSDIEHLKHIRYSIMSELMQATAVQNIKKEKGINTDKDSSTKGSTKGDLLKARNLTRYLNQLTVAKGQCERRLHLLGGPDYKAYTTGTNSQILTYPAVLQTPAVRLAFSRHLSSVGAEPLLQFWAAVDTMKRSPKGRWHQQGGEILHMYVAPSNSFVRSKLQRPLVKGMEAFVLGNTGPSAFWDAQKQVSQLLEEQFYPSFIVSDTYIQAMPEDDWNSDSAQEPCPLTPSPIKTHRGGGEEYSGAVKITDHSEYAQDKLKALDEKILNKTQAAKALKASHISDSKRTRVQVDLHQELDNLKTERRELEFHIDRTDIWSAHAGTWKATIYNAEVVRDEVRSLPLFETVVHLPGMVATQTTPGGSQGWVVYRKLDDFHALQRSLALIDPRVKDLKLPTIGKFRIKSLDDAFLKSAKEKLQEFLNEVLVDESLAQSETTFIFFSPSPEYLKQAPLHKSPSKFSLNRLLHRGREDSDGEDELLFGDDENPRDWQTPDSIAEPLYRLIGEVFELRGVFKWLRKTLMVFVQVSFGRSTNRQLKETVDWMFSESMMVYYLHMIRDSCWPDGHLTPPAPSRSDDDKLQMRRLAKHKILHNIPEALKNLVGEENARRGAIKVFESLQDVRLNKQLCYVLLELVLLEVMPELDECRSELLAERQHARQEDLMSRE